MIKTKNEVVLGDPAYGSAIIANAIVNAALTLGVALVFFGLCLCDGAKQFVLIPLGMSLVFAYIFSPSKEIKHSSEAAIEPKEGGEQ